MVKFVALATLLAASLGLVHGYAAGPPVTACGTMTPGHGPDPQTVASPYTVTVSKATYHSGEQLTVTVNSATETAFKGILLQARNTANGPAVGSWTTATGYKLLACDSSATSALSHSSSTEKTFPQSFTWTASASSSEPINFYATVVKEYDTFWVKTPSSAVSYTSATTKATATTTKATEPTIAKVTTKATEPTIAKVTTKATGQITAAPATNVTTTTTTTKATTTTSSSNKVVCSVHVCVLIVSLICLVIA